MSTTLYLKRFLNGASGLGAYFYASGFAPVGPAHAGDTHVVLGGDAGIQCTYNLSSGVVLAWVSPPIAAPVTISGAVSTQAGGEQDGSGGVNTQLQSRMYKYSGGVEGAQFFSASMGQILTITPTRYTWSGTPTSTSFAVGDRIVIKFYFVNFILAMQTGGSTIFYGDENSAAVGSTFIQFTENISFTQEPEYVQGDNAGVVNPFTATGTSLAHDAMVIVLGVSHGAVVSSISDGTNSYAFVSQISAGIAFDKVTYLAKDIAAGGPYSFTVSFTSGSLITIGYAEYFGVTTDPLDQNAIAAGVSNTFDSGSKTTTQATEIIFGSAQENSGVNFTVGAGFVKRTPFPDGSSIEIFVEDKLVTSIGSYKADGTLAGSDNWAAAMLTLKVITTSPPVTSGLTTILRGGHSSRMTPPYNP